MEPGQPVPLPRALDVQRFAGAREQEIRALCAALKQSDLGAKFGVAALPRHLRRRAGSHKPYHGHRFRPNAKLQSKRRKLNAASDEQPAAEMGGDAPAEAAAAGDAADTEAAEAAAGSVRQQYTNRRMRRQPAQLQERFRQAATWTEGSLLAAATATPDPQAGAVAGAAEGTASAPSGSNCGGPRLRHLETHVWHAKRLAMEERFGWVLPAGAAGQGRGSRSFVHVAKASALMHDASYLCPLLLRGPWRSMRSVLVALLDPADSATLAADFEYTFGEGSDGSDASNSGSGSSGGEQEVMLHHPGCFPLAAICPAQLLLGPCTVYGSGSSHRGGRGGAAGAMDVDAAAPVAGGAAAGTQPERGSSRGRGSGAAACLWVHPAAAPEAYAALQAAVEQHSHRQQGHAANGAAGGTAGGTAAVALSVLDVRRLEIRGGDADRALAVALAGATGGSTTSTGSSGSIAGLQPSGQQAPSQAAGPGAQQGQQRQHGQGRGQQQQQGQQAAHPVLPLPAALAGLPHGGAVQVLLADPRLRKPVGLGAASAALLPASQKPTGAQDPPEQLQQQVNQTEQEQQQPERQALDLCALEQVPLPLSESELSSRRQALRRQLLQLEAGGSGSGGSIAGNGGSIAGNGGSGSSRGAPRQRQQQQTGMEAVAGARAALAASAAALQQRGYCPAVLVRHDPPQAADVPGWSIILPAGWLPPFWLAVAYAGCKPAGQREWRWLAALQQRRSFPWDHPDTAAYAELMRAQELRRLAAAARRPKAKQMVAAPVSPPTWDALLPPPQRASEPLAPSASAAEQEKQLKQQLQVQQGQQVPQQGAEQQQAQQQHAEQPMEVDAGQHGPEPGTLQRIPAAPPAATSGPAGSASAAQRWYVARSYATMAAAVAGGACAAGNPSSGGVAGAALLGASRPVAAALRRGLLQWRPKEQPQQHTGSGGGHPTSCSAAPGAPAATATGGISSSSIKSSSSSGPCCLLEAALQLVKRGTAAEGAAVCLVVGREALQQRLPLQVLSSGQQCRMARQAEEQRAALLEAGGNPEEAVLPAGAPALAAAPSCAVVGNSTSSVSRSTEWVGEEQVQVIGYVLSEAPRGAPRRCGALAAVAAAPAWRLRSLQHWGPRRDGGSIAAFVRNPGTEVLYPVHLTLLAEQPH